MGLVTVWLEKLTRTVHSIVREVKAASRWRYSRTRFDVPVTEPLGGSCRDEGPCRCCLSNSLPRSSAWPNAMAVQGSPDSFRVSLRTCGQRQVLQLIYNKI